MTKKIPWARVFVEGVVIVGSILLAFGIDAWWEADQERDLERHYLGSLLLDLAADSAEVVRQLEITEGRIRSAEALVLSLGGTIDIAPYADGWEPLSVVPDTSSLRNALSQVARFTVFTPTRHTIDELRATGYLRLMTDADLKRQLSRYYFTVQRFGENYLTRERHYSLNELGPLTRRASSSDPVSRPLQDSPRLGETERGRVVSALRLVEGLPSALQHGREAALVQRFVLRDQAEEVAGLMAVIRDGLVR